MKHFDQFGPMLIMRHFDPCGPFVDEILSTARILVSVRRTCRASSRSSEISPRTGGSFATRRRGMSDGGCVDEVN